MMRDDPLTDAELAAIEARLDAAEGEDPAYWLDRVALDTVRSFVGAAPGDIRRLLAEVRRLRMGR